MGTVKLAIFHFSDFHSMLDSQVVEDVPHGSGSAVYVRTPGISRFITRLNAETYKAQKDGDQVLMFCSGDLSANTTIWGREFRGCAEFSLLNCLRTQKCVFLLGNHEVDFGVEPLVTALGCWGGSERWVCLSNTLLTVPPGRHVTPSLGKRYCLIDDFGGPKIGVVSMTKFPPSPPLIADLRYDCIANAIREMGSTDMLIVLSHLGLIEDSSMLIWFNSKHIPVDLILGGHDHIWYKDDPSNPHIVHSGHSGLGFSKIRYELSTPPKFITHEFVRVSPYEEGDLNCLAATSYFLSNPMVSESKHRVVGRTETLLNCQRERSEWSAFGTIGAEAIVESFRALLDERRIDAHRRIGLIGNSEFQELIPEGYITQEAVEDVFIYNNFIHVYEVEGRSLYHILRGVYRRITIDNLGPHEYLQVYNLQVDRWDPLIVRDSSGRQITGGDTEKYYVVTTSFVGAKYRPQFGTPLVEGGDTVTAFSQYLRAHTPISSTRYSEVIPPI
ncbi:MAG: metallophosphoesterase [Chloroflexi bacterium]|nr:metallophosphoesterase [Chloroflexota bacterium]